MYKYFKLLFLFSIYFILVSCNNIDRDEIDMYLAASLLSQVENSSKNYNDVVNIDSSGSYDLVNKIILGAEPDLVLLANYDLKNSLKSNFEFYENYSDNSVILVHNNSENIKLDDICENNYEIGVADPKRAPLGKISEEILEENKCSISKKSYNLRISSDASSLINLINLDYLNFALIYKNDFSKIKKEYNFSYSSQNFNKKLIYSFYINNDLNFEKRQKVIKFINYLKAQENKSLPVKSDK
ncbi:MAG: substrate-binding domain-containing protein [Dehalococcoidia bacterium]